MTVFIEKGDKNLSKRQAIKRGLRYFEAEKAQWEREQGIVESDPDYIAWANQWITDNLVNAENNVFNYHLEQYRIALARLEQYLPAEGRPAKYEELPTGELDPETGQPIMETVLIVPEIEPVPAQIQVPIYNEETSEQTGVTLKANPLIVKDTAERAAAQAIVDNTPQDVKDFDL